MVTEETIVAKVQELVATFKDGFQVQDVAVVLRAAVEFAELAELPGEEKRAIATRVLERVIDETDTPWLPDAFVDPFLKRMVPSLIDLVVDATKNGVAVNRLPG